MLDANNTPEKKLEGLDPRKTFFMVVIAGNLNGSLDIESETPDGFVTLEEAINFARKEVEENDCESYIYECHPVKRVRRLQVIVEHI